MEQVILVDEKDNEIGIMEKQQAHLEGRLHRAVSVFVFNSKAQLLLQQRHHTKYHSGSLWTNTCCSHPHPNEIPLHAANRRLFEEMGIKCSLTEAYSFVYKAHLDHGMTEHEFDHVFIGISDDTPVPNPEEVAGWKYIDTDALALEIKTTPEIFTEWFKICINQWHSKLFPPAKKKSYQ